MLILGGMMGCETIDNPGETLPEVIDVVGDVDIGATVDNVLEGNKVDHDTEEPYSWKREEAGIIRLLGQTVSETMDGVSFIDQTLLIKAAGVYRLTGTLENGRVLIDTDDDSPVILILDGVTIQCAFSSPLFVADAECVVIDLVEQTENKFTDGSTYVFDSQDEDEPNAAIFSKDDLTITGGGTLQVEGNYQDGIASKDGLVIKGGKIAVVAADDGIRGKDYLVIRDGNISIDAGGDGLKSTNDEEGDCGYIYIESGTLQITAEGDAISAETDALIREVSLEAVTGGGVSRVNYSDVSSKGIKGLVYNVIDGGTFSITSADDAVHSNYTMIINGGIFSISTGDDAFHADSLLVVNDGKIVVAECYEGVESAVIDITGGSLNIVSSDDGLNVVGGNDGSGMRPGGGPGGPGGPGGDQFASSGNYYLFIEGGDIAVNSLGDGIDINGAVVMSEGKLIIDGPSSNMNGALDYDRSFEMNGGFLLGVGSAGMAQAPGSGSSQYSVLVNFSSSISAGTLVHLGGGSGEGLFTFSPTKTFQSVVFSSPDLEVGSMYQIYYGGTASGTLKDGLLVDGSYTPGTRYREFSISGITTLIR